MAATVRSPRSPKGSPVAAYRSGYCREGPATGPRRELGLPRTLRAATRVLVDPGTRVGTVDLGRIGDRVFVLRAGIGAIVEVDRLASREMKDRVGGLAYVSAGLEVLRRTEPSRYRVTIDDKVVEQEAVACIVANGAGFGGFGVLAEGVSMTDGVLDVFLYGARGTRGPVRADLDGGSPPAAARQPPDAKGRFGPSHPCGDRDAAAGRCRRRVRRRDADRHRGPAGPARRASAAGRQEGPPPRPPRAPWDTEGNRT